MLSKCNKICFSSFWSWVTDVGCSLRHLFVILGDMFGYYKITIQPHGPPGSVQQTFPLNTFFNVSWVRLFVLFVCVCDDINQSWYTWFCLVSHCACFLHCKGFFCFWIYALVCFCYDLLACALWRRDLACFFFFRQIYT